MQLKKDILVQPSSVQTSKVKNLLQNDSKALSKGISNSSIKLYCERKKSIQTKQNDTNKNNLLMQQAKNDDQMLGKLVFRLKLRDQMKKIVERTCARRQFNLSKENCHFLNDKASEYCQDDNQQMVDKMQSFYQNVNMQKELNKLKENEQMQKKYKQELMQKKQKYQYFKEIIKRLFLDFPVFAPSHNYKLVWDLIVSTVCIAIMFFIPISFLYNQPLPDLLGYQLNTLSPILLLLDLLVKLNTGFYRKGKICKSRTKIFFFFLKNNWFSDLIPLLIFLIAYIMFKYVDSSAIEAKICRLLLFFFFTRISQLLKILHTIEETASLNPRAANIIQLFQVFILILFVSHFFASMWLYLGLNSSYAKEKQTWLYERNIQDSSWTVQYLQSYYYATVTMITVGYGDVTPQNPQEMLFCVLSMMFCCGVFAYSINQVGTIFDQFFHLENELKQNMKVINNYMKNKKVNQDLQYQVRQYLDYYWREESSQDVSLESKIISQLSDGLRETLLMEANKIALIDSPIFRENFSGQVIAKTVPLIKEMRFTPEEVIFDEDKIDSIEGSIYFIEKGKVEICSYYAHPIAKKQQMVNKIIELSSGDSFGQISFFTGKRRSFSVRSLEFCRMLVIRRNDFIQLLQEYPDDYEKFCMIRDKILMQNDTSSIVTKCFACKKTDHLVSECPYIHFLPNKQKVIHQEQRGMNQHRVIHIRRKKLPYFELSELMEGALQVLQNYKEIIIENYDFYGQNSSDESNEEDKDEVLDFNNQAISQRQQVRKTSLKIQPQIKMGSLSTFGNKQEMNNIDQHNNIFSQKSNTQEDMSSDQNSNLFPLNNQNYDTLQQQQQMSLQSALSSSQNNVIFLENIQNKPKLKQRRTSQMNSTNSIKFQTLDEGQTNESIQANEFISLDQLYLQERIQSTINNLNNKSNLQEEINFYQAICNNFNKQGVNASNKMLNNNPQQTSKNKQFQIVINQNNPTQFSRSTIQFPKRSSIESNLNLGICTEQEIKEQKKKVFYPQPSQGLVGIKSKTHIQRNNGSLMKDFFQYEQILNLIDTINKNKTQYEYMETNSQQLITDTMKNYKVYFPHNNISTILEIMHKKDFNKIDYQRKLSNLSSNRQSIIKLINKVNDDLQLMKRKSIFSLRHSVTNNGEQAGCSPLQAPKLISLNDSSFNRSQSFLSKISKMNNYLAQEENLKDQESNLSLENENSQEAQQDNTGLSNEVSIDQTKTILKNDLFNELCQQNSDKNIQKMQSSNIFSKNEVNEKNINVLLTNKKKALCSYNKEKN